MTTRIAIAAALLCWTSTVHVHAQSSDPSSETATTTEEENSEAQARLDAKRSSARQLATSASAEYRAGRYKEAYNKFNRAFKLVGVPALGVWSARSLRRLNRFVEAAERYRDVLKKGTDADAPAAHQKALKNARSELKELQPRIPNLIIRIKDAELEDIEVEMDGKGVDDELIGVKQLVDPGTRKIIARRGDETIAREVALTEGETREIVLPFDPAWIRPADAKPNDEPATGPSAPSAPAAATGLSTIEVTGIVGMATGGVIFAAGIATTLVALNHQEELREGCTDAGCPPELHSKLSTFNTLRPISTATLIGGAVIGATGAALYFGSQSKKEQAAKDASVGVYIGANRLGLVGSF